MRAIITKELSDYYTGLRGLIVLGLIAALTALALHAAYYGIRGSAMETGYIFMKLYTTAESSLPDIMNFQTLLALFIIPIMGITLAFDAVNGERANGTISSTLSQGIYRDQYINAKIISGVIILATMILAGMLFIGGFGLRIIGIPPSMDELTRLVIFYLSAVVYGIFWLGLAMVFSIIFKRTSTSAMIMFGLWLFFSIFYLFLIAPGIANVAIPVGSGTDAAAQAAADSNSALQQLLMRFSPSYIFLESSSVLLMPLVRSLGLVDLGQMAYMVVNPLKLAQSLVLCMPHLVSMIALAAATLAGSYVLFMRQEIRS